MAELRCPKCGRNNPDILEVCQFCQTSLKPDPFLRIGQTPTKKDTGELEAILPDWLKDVRQQARSSAEDDAAQAASQPRVEKEEPPDLLAGLVSQVSAAGEEEIPDWLASMRPDASETSATPPAASESDFFAQFDRSEAKPAAGPAPSVPPASEPAADQPPASTEDDDLSKWFARAAEQPEEIVEFEPEAASRDETAWAGRFDAPTLPQQEPAPKEEEDLSWLHHLEDASKQTGDVPAPKQETDWMANFEAPAASSQPSGSQEDLSWLDNLGGIETAPQAPLQPATTGDDLSWLGSAGTPSEHPSIETSPAKPISARPFAAEEDLSWLNNLGETPASAQPAEAAPASSSSQPEDLSWLSNLGVEPASQFTPPFTTPEPGVEGTPRRTAPLDRQAETEPPDWLKSAMEAPSMPPPGDSSMDWLSGKGQPPDAAPASAPQPAPFSDLFSTPAEAPSGSGENVDSLFSVEMPDWLSRAEPATSEPALSEPAPPPAGSEESLAPVNLPSWVQAMRPMEAVISEAGPGAEEEPEEKEGPLAGLRGVIPGMAIGSSMRPKAVSLKLQATNEQQASAALLEKILESETNPRPLITSSFVWSQQWLRRALTGLFLIVLSIAIFFGSQTMEPSANLPPEGLGASDVLLSLPAGAKVLVVIDYEPSLAGEMEAVGGPLLRNMVQLKQPTLSFLSTSPNGTALVERLMASAKINKPAPDGFEYQAGEQYCNLGYLPGGSAGILGYMQAPVLIIPSACEEANVDSFSAYSALIVMTDQAESGRAWVEQLHAQKQIDPVSAHPPLIVIASAQAGPLLQPYVSSQQITGMISGLSEATRYEYKNALAPITRSYWDAFGIGLAMSVALIAVGSLWSLITGIRARRAEAEQG